MATSRTDDTRADDPRPSVSDLSYAEAGIELDGIIEEFETGVVDVDRLVEQLERATDIVDELDRRLRRTRLQVEELVPRLEAIGRRDASASGPPPEDEVLNDAGDGGDELDDPDDAGTDAPLGSSDRTGEEPSGLF